MSDVKQIHSDHLSDGIPCSREAEELLQALAKQEVFSVILMDTAQGPRLMANGDIDPTTLYWLRDMVETLAAANGIDFKEPPPKSILFH